MIEVSYFEEIVHRFKTPVFGFLFRLVQDEPLAEQLTEQTFLRLHRLGRYCGNEGQCATAIYRLAIQSEMESGGVSKLLRPSPLLATGDKEAAIRLAIGGLPKAERLAVLLHKYQALDLVLIGRILDLHETTVKRLLLTAYRSLRMTLGRYVDPERERN